MLLKKAVGHTLYVTIQLLLQFLFVYFLHHHTYLLLHFNDFYTCNNIWQQGLCELQKVFFSLALVLAATDVHDRVHLI